MPPKQMPILFEDDDTPKKQKPLSKTTTMQSEEDWTPQPLPKEDKPAADAAKPKTKRTAAPRVRKPRLTKAEKEASEKAAPASAAPKAPEVSAASAPEKKERPARRGRPTKKVSAEESEAKVAEPVAEKKRAETPASAPRAEQEKAAPAPRAEERGKQDQGDRDKERSSQAPDRGEKREGADRQRQSQEREGRRDQDQGDRNKEPSSQEQDRGEKREGVDREHQSQEREGRRDQEQGGRIKEPSSQEQDRGEKREGADRERQSREREGRRDQDGGQDQDRRSRHEQHGGRRDRDERHGNRHGGGSGDRRGDRQQQQQQDNFRNKKKNKKGGGQGQQQRFERPSGGGGHHGGGGGGHQHGGGAMRRPAGLPDSSRFQNIEEMSRQVAEITGEPFDLARLYEISLPELVEAAQKMEVVLDAAANRRLLISRMMEKAREDSRPILDRGILDVTPAGYGFIARHAHNYRVHPEDTFVAESFIRRYGLQKGHLIEGNVWPTEEGDRCPALVRVNEVMGQDPEKVSDIVPFEDLIPYYPLERILLEIPSDEPTKDVSMRAIDLLTPIGFGQRGLIVAPPRTGKTVILQQIANSIATNNPDSHLLVLLIDERPEEVTDFRRNVRGEVVSSTFDEPAESHVEVAEAVIEKARRMVESGRHVIILLDSITRLARAYNAMMPSSGKILSGGVEANALQKPKRFFGAARNIEGGGSLTILATALIDTGSRMDEVIFEEFKGTGNMEIHLDRALVDKRIFPALNIERSGTRKEELLYHPDELSRIYSLRRAIQGVPIVEAMEMLVQRLKKTGTNAEFLMGMNR